MASEEHLGFLELGVEPWNRFRAHRPEERPDLREAVLQGFELAGVQLAGADLRGADLASAELNGADLHGADLVDACLRSCALEGADLRGADLSRANLTGARMADAVLDGAILDGATLVNADLRRARLSKATLRGARLGYANLSAAELVGANLTEAQLLLTDLRGANLERVILRDAVLVRCTLNAAKLQSSDLVFATLRGCLLVGANLWYADLSHASLKGCELGRAELAGATVAGTVLCDIDLSQVNGLDSVRHEGPSTVGLDTLERTAAGVAADAVRRSRMELFLRGTGASEAVLDAFRALVADPPMPRSCFLSFYPSDLLLVRRVFDRLQSHGVRCWLDEHRMLPGEDICDRVDRELRPADRVLLCASRASLASWWFQDDVAKTLAFEAQLTSRGAERPETLLVLDLDDCLAAGDQAGELKRVLEERVAARLAGWEENPTVLDAEMERLLRRLGVELR